MIAVDTNILVYAHREDSDSHEIAYRRLSELAEGRATWAIPWPCLHEFLAIVTHTRIFVPPTTLPVAIDQIEAWLESPNVVLLAETELHWPRLREALQAGKITGPVVHDARIAALCSQHGVRELWSADRDFGRFPELVVTNPLVGWRSWWGSDQIQAQPGRGSRGRGAPRGRDDHRAARSPPLLAPSTWPISRFGLRESFCRPRAGERGGLVADRADPHLRASRGCQSP